MISVSMRFTKYKVLFLFFSMVLPILLQSSLHLKCTDTEISSL